MKYSQSRPHVVIAGFGETGLLTAIYLNEKYKNRYRITAISTKPSLVSGQELGTRLAQPEQWKKNYYNAFERYKHLQGVAILHGQVLVVNAQDKSIEVLPFVETDASEASITSIDYDVLLIASGVTNGFWRTCAMQSDAQIQHSIDDYAERFTKANTIAVIGGGPSGASCSYQLKQAYTDKAVDFYFSGDKPLPHHHPSTQEAVIKQLTAAGVKLHPGHRALQPAVQTLSYEPVSWSTGQASAQADIVLWTVGNARPNSSFLPSAMLDGQGYVDTNQYLQVPGFEAVFCVGDIANTDKNRSSARNFAFRLVAENIHHYLQQRPQKMRQYQAPDYRWGSVLGIQDDGLRVFTAKGGMFRFPKWSIDRVLFPIFVEKCLYRGVKKSG